jgi:hypothetical protein
MRHRGTDMISTVVSFVLSKLRHFRFLGRIRLNTIVTNNTGQLLNLPGAMRFYPTDVVDAAAVRTLIETLHPIMGGRGLIRLGSSTDGGYLIPDDLEGIKACFSPGVSDVADFEFDCATRGMNVFMADASVQGPPVAHERFHFTRKFIGATTDGSYVTLADWVNASVRDTGGDLLLQMDIEGAEYEALLAAPTSLLERFRIIIVEFHHLDRFFCGPVFPIYRYVFEKLLATHHCVHIHPNNCLRPITVDGLEVPRMAEFTFLRTDRLTDHRFATQFPHPLDRDNVPGETVTLPKSFYRSV